MYLIWTPVGYPTIEGVQGRYALPLLLAGLFAWPILPRRFARIAPFAAGGATVAIGTVTLMWPESVIQYLTCHSAAIARRAALSTGDVVVLGACRNGLCPW